MTHHEFLDGDLLVFLAFQKEFNRPFFAAYFGAAEEAFASRVAFMEKLLAAFDSLTIARDPLKRPWNRCRWRRRSSRFPLNRFGLGFFQLMD